MIFGSRSFLLINQIMHWIVESCVTLHVSFRLAESIFGRRWTEGADINECAGAKDVSTYLS